jgi:glycosyltransferase involved in cell wall biosynthesis
MTARKLRVLVELRPAFDGHAGIPQETRLLFNALRKIESLEVIGLIQHSGHVLEKGIPIDGRPLPDGESSNRLSRVVISTRQSLRNPWIATILMGVRQFWGFKEKLTRFDATHFYDFIWRTFFAPTLHPDDFENVVSADYRVASLPWTGMQRLAIAWNAIGLTFYPRLDTSEFDFFIAETPFPARISKNTQLIVRYHDAIPVFMPHTIADRRFHQAFHFRALRQNVEDGAQFVCVSAATRTDLLAIFPQLASRAAVIHNFISHHYFREAMNPRIVADVLRSRRNERADAELGIDGRLHTPAPPPNESQAQLKPRYLLMVSTIEPRKNHLTLLSAWEYLRAHDFPEVQLVLVGSLGWEHGSILKQFKAGIEDGRLVMLADVPAPELRTLYAHAVVTVCPSFAEGYDFSGVEAIRSGGRLVASDIPVHREVFGTAASYFSTYSVEDLASKLRAVLAEPGMGVPIEAYATPSMVGSDASVLTEEWRALLLR